MKGDEAVHSHKSSKLRLRAVERKHWTFNNKKTLGFLRFAFFACSFACMKTKNGIHTKKESMKNSLVPNPVRSLFLVYENDFPSKLQASRSCGIEVFHVFSSISFSSLSKEVKTRWKKSLWFNYKRSITDSYDRAVGTAKRNYMGENPRKLTQKLFSLPDSKKKLYLFAFSTFLLGFNRTRRR
jgi:hypothetical protein